MSNFTFIKLNELKSVMNTYNKFILIYFKCSFIRCQSTCSSSSSSVGELISRRNQHSHCSSSVVLLSNNFFTNHMMQMLLRQLVFIKIEQYYQREIKMYCYYYIKQCYTCLPIVEIKITTITWGLYLISRRRSVDKPVSL